MKVETHHIPSQGLDLSFEKEADDFPPLRKLAEKGACEFIKPVSIDLHVLPMRDFIKVEGGVNTIIRNACVRCLEIFDLPLKKSFSLSYSKEIPNELHHDDKEGVELTAQQIGIIFYEGDEIDFTDALQEQVLLAMPFHPICTEGCKGLCSRCGQNLNKGGCQCDEEVREGPFAAFKKELEAGLGLNKDKD